MVFKNAIPKNKFLIEVSDFHSVSICKASLWMICRSYGTRIEASSFLLCMASPFIQTMICGHFSEGGSKSLDLNDVDPRLFGKLLDLFSGDILYEEDIHTVLQLAGLADRLQITLIRDELETLVSGQLTAALCVDVLMRSRDLGLKMVEASSLKMIRARFNEVTCTIQFMNMDEDALRNVLEDDSLNVRKEEEAFEQLVAWMKGGEGELRGQGLLSAIRFRAMDEQYLRGRVYQIFRPEHVGWIRPFVDTALAEKYKIDGDESKNVSRRVSEGVRWERYANGGEIRLDPSDEHFVISLAQCEERVYSATFAGKDFRIWNKSTLKLEKTIDSCSTDFGSIHCLAVGGGFLICGHHYGDMSVWNLVTGEPQWRQRSTEDLNHKSHVYDMEVVGSQLLSCSNDKTVKVWSLRAEQPWPCLKTLVHLDSVYAVAEWQGKALGGSCGVIRVWDICTGLMEADLLTGNNNKVTSLVVHKIKDMFFSASQDGSIRSWTLGTWSALRKVFVHDLESEPLIAVDQYKVLCLALSGGMVLSGSSHGEVGLLHVWNPDTLVCEHIIQRTGHPGWFNCIMPVDGEVWCGVEAHVVIWGRD